MNTLIDWILTFVSVAVIGVGGTYTVKRAFTWSRTAALEKVAHGLGQLEPAAQKMTGGKLDF